MEQWKVQVYTVSGFDIDPGWKHRINGYEYLTVVQAPLILFGWGSKNIVVNVRTHGKSGFNWCVRESPHHAISVPSGLELGRDSLLSNYFGIPGPRESFYTSLSLWQWWSFFLQMGTWFSSRANTMITPYGLLSSFETFLASCFCYVYTLMWGMQYQQEALATARSESVSVLIWILLARSLCWAHGRQSGYLMEISFLH